MHQSEPQIKLAFYQTLNRICEMEALADQLHKLADSYLKEERSRPRLVREGSGKQGYIPAKSGPGEALMEQAQELRAVASEWYRQAKLEYHENLQEADREAWNRRKSG